MKKKILLVEYATGSIDIIKEILSDAIFEITVANEGDKARTYLDEKPFDLMITAAMLPKFHGFNLSQYAAEHYPGIKIIIISEIYKGMDYKHQAMTTYKADDFFEKPFDKEEFRKRVLELLEIDEAILGDAAEKTAAEGPLSDTKKVRTLKQMEKEKKKLTSEDLFGDIIEKVHELPAYEIDLDTDMDADLEKKEAVTREFASPLTQMLDKEKISASQKSPAVTEVLQTPTGNKTQKIDLELLDLIKSGKKEKKTEVINDKRKFKKIEDDISRKLEDTLSGLGLAGKPAAKPEGTSPEETRLVKPPQAKTQEKEKTGEVEVGDYEILGLIGRGGMAEIYKAKKKGVKGFEKIIALKKILSGYGADAKYIEMFVDEAKIAAELSHPNIIQIYDLGKKDDYYFIAMEYISSKDLRVILQKLAQSQRIMPEALSIYLVIKVLEALNYAHAARDSSGKKLDIVHRDVSPPNILVAYDGNIKLTDFGVSKASIKMHQTLAGALKGKVLYMSPEQAKGEDNIDYRSDLYSVGIILFELITGEKLFLGSSEIGTLKKVQEGKIIKPSQIKKDIEPELEFIILKALNKDRTKRYQRALDMIKDLEAYMMHQYESAPEAAHIAHFICNLFKDEIIKEGIEINLPPHPHPISRRSKKEVKAQEELPEKEEEIFGLPEEDQLEEALQSREEKEAEQYLLKEEEFQPIVEITFDEDKNKKVPPGEKAYQPAPPASLPEVETLMQEEKSKRRKNFLAAIIIVIIVLAVAIILYLVLGSREPGPGSASKPVSAVRTTETTETTGTTGTTSTEVVSSQPEMKPAIPPSQQAPTALTTGEPGPGRGEEPGEKRELQKETSQLMAKDEKVTADKPGKMEKTEKAETGEVKPRETPTPQPDKLEKEPELPQEKEKPAEEPIKQTIEEQKPPDLAPEEIVKEGDILSPSQVDTQPVPISTPPIKITPAIRRLLTSDQRVLVSYLVDHNGSVETVKVLNKSSLKRLNTLIIGTIKSWQYKPATKNNVRVKVWKNKWIAIKK
ncbi:MAG: protein kinase [Candidatus Aminicenantes bacterium]|nr:MAG: protein kinase [Candidatus Aminicenantes bacterium]